MNIIIPTSWQQLTPGQARWLLRILASWTGSIIELKAIVLLRLCAIEIVGKMDSTLSKLQYEKKYLIRNRRQFIEITVEEFALMLREIDWIIKPLRAPWRPDRIAARRPKPASLDSLPFGKFLTLDNLYAGFLAARTNSTFKIQNSKLIARMADIMISQFRLRLSAADEFIIIMWFVAVKERFIKLYPDLYGAVNDSASLAPDDAPLQISQAKLVEAMNAQIRALTKGDITKEKEILSLPVSRAMTELNALAREARELKEKSRSK